MIAKHVTLPMLLVLRAMLELDREAYGLEIAKRTRLHRSTCYMMLKRFVKSGYVADRWEDGAEGRPPRKYYTLVPERRAEVVALLTERGIDLPEVPF